MTKSQLCSFIVCHKKTMQRVCCKLHHSVPICSLAPSARLHYGQTLSCFCSNFVVNFVGPSMWWASSSSAIYCSCTNQLDMICAESLASSKWSKCCDHRLLVCYGAQPRAWAFLLFKCVLMFGFSLSVWTWHLGQTKTYNFSQPLEFLLIFLHAAWSLGLQAVARQA